MDDLKVTCTVTNPNGEKRELALLSRNQANGSYEGVYEETSVLGDYHVEATCKDAQAKLGDKWPKPFVTSFAVKSSFAPVEYTHQSSDRAVADEMAKFTSGSVVMLYDATNVTFTFASSTTNRFTSTTNHLPTTNYQLTSALAEAKWWTMSKTTFGIIRSASSSWLWRSYSSGSCASGGASYDVDTV